MFRTAWDVRSTKAQEIVQSAKRQIADLDRQIDKLLARIIDTGNERVVRTYEDRIGDLEREKVLLAEKLAQQAEPRGSFEEKLEPVLTFLANPWKLWESGHITLRCTVLNWPSQTAFTPAETRGLEPQKSHCHSKR
ncbi:MAG: hypothetical protein AAGD08_21325 [Pseudomonadota bacterium]